MSEKYLVVVGASACGKTTFVNGLREACVTDNFSFPVRYITRPLRKNDDLVENTHITLSVFQEMVQSKEIFPSWKRDIGIGKEVHYGFANSKNSSNVILSANNAFIESIDSNVFVKKVLSDAYVVLIHANRETRDERLRQRSPDMSTEERKKRLSDESSNLLNSPYISELIETDGLSNGDLNQIAHKFAIKKLGI